MTRYPELVGGEGRFCTLLMNTFAAALVGKLGADMDVEKGQAAARSVGLVVLSAVRAKMGSLDSVMRVSSEGDGSVGKSSARSVRR